MSPSPILGYLQDLLERLRGLDEGQLASYIPELTRANPAWFGICIATRDGFIYEVGDSGQPFTIQSVSKPLTYGLALQERGEAEVARRIGVEPSGDAFNAISLHPQTGAPKNPLINAGAITACGLVPGRSAGEKIGRILDTFSRYAGRELDIDQEVYRSESATGHRNRAIGWMLRNFAVLEDDPTETLETYFQQCAIRVTCRDLALMAATLANAGINPITGKRAITEHYVQHVLSVMATCGMYDASGEWMYRTGLPAKSGVGGGIMAVQPGRLGIAVFSPRLDAQGNSVRGIAACHELAGHLGLHMFDAAQRMMPALRLATTRRQVPSRQRRTPEAAEYLRLMGKHLRLKHLHGMLVFATIEPIVRQLMEQADRTEFFILNLKMVQGIDPASAQLLARTRRELASRDRMLVFSDAAVWWQTLVDAGVDREAFYADDDFALEHGESMLLERGFPDTVWQAEVGLEQCALFQGLDQTQLAQLEPLLGRRSFQRGKAIINAGKAADELFVITRGSAMVSISTPDGMRRLDAFTSGMSFGEMAFLDGSPRSANVTALGAVDCLVLTREAFARLDQEAPAIKIRLLQNLAQGLSSMLRQANRELSVLK